MSSKHRHPGCLVPLHLSTCQLLSSICDPCIVMRDPCARAEISEMMPGIMNQLGPDSMKDLKRMMGSVRAGAGRSSWQYPYGVCWCRALQTLRQEDKIVSGWCWPRFT